MNTLSAMLATARRWHPVLWRTQRDDVVQTAQVALLEFQRHGGSWKSHLSRAMREYMPSPVVGRWHKRLGYDLSPERCASAFEAHGTVDAAAAAMGINHGTLAKRLSLTPAKERMAIGGKRGCATRWGNYDTRRAKAREMRASGMKLEDIRVALGYKSIASVHYAVRVG